MTHEEKMLARLVKARASQARKKSVFNLNDDEEGTTLTHFGRALGDIQHKGVGMGDDDFDGALS